MPSIEALARPAVGVLLGLIAGIAIAFRDLRADDVQLAVGLIILAAALCALVAGRLTWLVAIAVGVGVPLVRGWAASTKHPVLYESSMIGLLLPFIPAFLGAYAAAFVRALLSAQ